MNNIMTHVVTEGTGRAAQIPGLIISGKTGTTNNSTNAWFNAFTGNLVGSVWFGNDDNSPMENMTGGRCPRMTWQEIMVFAHQGLETKPPFGVAAPPAAPERAGCARRREAAPELPKLRLSRSVFRRAPPTRSSISAIWRGGAQEQPERAAPEAETPALRAGSPTCAKASLRPDWRERPSA